MWLANVNVKVSNQDDFSCIQDSMKYLVELAIVIV